MSGQIFISYRRDDASYPAGRLYDRLSAHFLQNQIFIDVDNLEPGADFVEAIEASVGSCDALIAVIGKRWLISSDEEGKRRLDSPDDFVRLEIATALKRNIRVIPVLVDGALMPRSSDLPDDLKLLVRRNAVEVSHSRFNADLGRLIAALEKVLEKADAERKQREGISNGKSVPASHALTQDRSPASAEVPAITRSQRADMRNPLLRASGLVFVLISIAGVLWFAGSKLKYGRQGEAPVTSTPTSTPIATGSNVALRNYWKPNGVVNTDHAMAFRAWLKDNENGVDIATFIYSSQYATEWSKAVAALIRPNQSENPSVAEDDSTALRNYWKPNGVVNTDHAMAFRAWLKDNENGVDIATFIYSSQYATEWSKAVAALIRPNQLW